MYAYVTFVVLENGTLDSCIVKLKYGDKNKEAKSTL